MIFLAKLYNTFKECVISNMILYLSLTFYRHFQSPFYPWRNQGHRLARLESLNHPQHLLPSVLQLQTIIRVSKEMLHYISIHKLKLLRHVIPVSLELTTTTYPTLYGSSDMLTFKTNGRKGNIYSSTLSGISLFVDKYCVWWNQESSCLLINTVYGETKLNWTPLRF